MADRKRGNNLEQRLSHYGGKIVLAVSELPVGRDWKHIRDQLLRSGTAPGAHYSEAQGAQSRADFVHKVAVALKEQREAVHWLRVCVAAERAPSEVVWLLDEGLQLVAILAASLRTARKGREE